MSRPAPPTDFPLHARALSPAPSKMKSPSLKSPSFRPKGMQHMRDAYRAHLYEITRAQTHHAHTYVHRSRTGGSGPDRATAGGAGAILWFVSPLPTMTNSGPSAYKGKARLVKFPLDTHNVI